jgi:hypothetical protein
VLEEFSSTLAVQIVKRTPLERQLVVALIVDKDFSPCMIKIQSTITSPDGDSYVGLQDSGAAV